MKKLILVILMIFSILVLNSLVMAADKVTLKFMGWEASPFETSITEQSLKQFMKENPDIKVEYTPVSGEYPAKLLTMIAGDAAPDVFFIASDSYRSFQKRGVLLNLTGYFNKEMDIDEFIPLARDKMLIDGGIYGVSSCDVSPVLFYNKKLFDEAGLPYPPNDPEKAWTWDKFVDIAKQLTVRKNGKTVQYGVSGFTIEWVSAFSAMVKSNGGQVFNEDYTELLLDSPEAKEALVEIKNLQRVYGVSPLVIANVQQGGISSTQMLQTGRLAMLVDGSWTLQQLAEMDFPLGIGVLPKFKEPVTIGQAHLYSAWVKTKHPDEAWELIKFVSSREYQTKLVKTGIWLPNRMDMYEEENLANWMNPDVYPGDFVNMLKYFTNYAELWVAVKVPSEAWSIINEELGTFFVTDQSIDTVISRMKKRVEPILNK
ncbi:sugar ABC transporter substrate-binding protein [Candidatus Atribacteria bacterium 1244-E10-H5-B2]|jgi:multiple sugar transport system substrate-binding protein|nr:MAG: sugar ABC transporter substrate-binding protein [Candidatus Atribacteria bacterium 1244-E10-H5-B2]